MKQKFNKNRIRFFICAQIIVFLSLNVNLLAFNSLRRPVSSQSPLWLIHIDTWSNADPQRIIDLVPKDIRPYVVMNISLSISHDTASTSQRYRTAEYGYEIAKSWLRACAENRMWAMIQVASGGMTQISFSDHDLAVYEDLFNTYPNLIGFNYAEQFWGFDAKDFCSVPWVDRISHFADMLKLCNKYGAYLVVSWCGNIYSPNINPIAMLKRNAAFEAASRTYPQNYILEEKYTQGAYHYDVESTCLGAYLSGYSGQYGIRYDDTGFGPGFTLATAGAPHLEHIMLTGETVIDGPETIPTNSIRILNNSTTTDGYTRRNWGTFARFDEMMVDMFRKILDGTVRIPTRQEVIDRTKYVIVNDVSSGNNDSIYSSPTTLFQGLYRMDGDGDLGKNLVFFKKTGRYPTIPTVYQLADNVSKTFKYQINKSNYGTRWPDIASKVAEFNTEFPKEYTGDLYAGRYENSWVVYNPYKIDTASTIKIKRANAFIPFKYNTCDSLELSFSRYSSGIVKEYANKVTFYLNNFDEQLASTSTLYLDSIQIYGCTSEPTWSYADRANHVASIVNESWNNGIFSLQIQHNGPLDVTVNCSGTATNRLTSYTPATLVSPALPAYYTGERQYEAECFQYKNITGVVTSGYYDNIRKYTGQGYIRFGKNPLASVRDTINVLRRGTYRLTTRYSTVGGDVSTIDLYVNGIKVATPTFTATATDSSWTTNTQSVALDSGRNCIEFRANSAAPYSVTMDNITVVQGSGATIYDFTNDSPTASATTPAAQYVSVQSGTAGVVSYIDGNGISGNSLKTYGGGTTNTSGVADLDLFPSSSTDYHVVWKEYFGEAGGKNGVLLRSTGSNGSCAYADGMKQGYLFTVTNNADNTVSLKQYMANATGLDEKTGYTSTFAVASGQPCWFRASAYGNQLRFECSKDSVNWEGGTTATFTDATYATGSTELVWGLGSNNFGQVIDNITYLTGDVSASVYAMSGFSYQHTLGASGSQKFSVSGKSLANNLLVLPPTNFEVSLDGQTYSPSLSIAPISGSISQVKVYVRLKAGLAIGSYSGTLTVSSNGIGSASLTLSGSVTPQIVTQMYDFTGDAASTTATTPPATNITVGNTCTATGGVVSLTEASGYTSNMFKPYSAGQRNSSGAFNLDLFSTTATDYSVTWKQVLGTLSDSKVGMLLRGNASNVSTSSTVGYVQGLMPGYLFIAYYASSGPTIDFRIYKSTSSTSLTGLKMWNALSVSLTAKQPLWLRASVSGTSSVTLKFEYSTDSVTWKTGSTYTDANSTIDSGSTQIAWGLGATNLDFYLDDIVFSGITNDATTDMNAPIQSESDAKVVSSEYYTIMGQEVSSNRENLHGLYIVRCRMSDGTIMSKKLFLK